MLRLYYLYTAGAPIIDLLSQGISTYLKPYYTIVKPTPYRALQRFQFKKMYKPFITECSILVTNVSTYTA